MIKDIIVIPRIAVVDIIKNRATFTEGNWFLISIYTSPRERLVGDEEEKILKDLKCQDILSLCFGDFTDIKYSKIKDILESSHIDTRLFDETDADKIINFVNKIKNDINSTPLIVHCDAGISRSGAVGLFLCRYLNLDEKNFKKINKRIYPNMYIYNMLAQKSGLLDDYKEWWNKNINSKNIWR